MKKNFFKRSLAFIITLALALSLMPTFAFATGDTITVNFNTSEMKLGSPAYASTATVSATHWSVVASETNNATVSNSIDSSNVWLNLYYSSDEHATETWLNLSSANKRRMQFTISVKVENPGWYDLTLNTATHNKGVGMYIFADGQFVGYYDNSVATGYTTKKFDSIYLSPDENGEVKVMFTRVSTGTAKMMGLKSLVLTPTTAPSEKSVSVKNTSGEEIENVNLTNGESLDFTAQALLDDVAVNYSGYTSTATADDATIKVEVTGDAVTFTNDRTNYTDEVLNGKLTAVKNGNATVKLTATFGDGSTTEKTVNVNVKRGAYEPITLNFNKSTMTATADTFKLSQVTVSETAGWDIVRDESNKWDVAGYPSSFDGNTGLWLNILIQGNPDTYTWISIYDKYKGQFTFKAKDVTEGWYDIKLATMDHPKGANAFLYADGNYVGSFTCASNTGKEDVFKNVYLTPDEDDEVKFMIAKVSDGENRFIGLESIVLTPTTAPTDATISTTLSGTETLEKGESLDFTANALLDDAAVNYSGYTSAAAADDTTIKVEVTGDAVTFTNDRTNHTDEVLNGKLTAVKSGTATVTITANLPGDMTATKTITVTVPSVNDPDISNAFTTETPVVTQYNPTVFGAGYNTSEDSTTVEGITETAQADGSYKMYAPEKNGDANFLYWAKGLSLNKKIVSYDNEFYYTPAGGDNNILIAVYDNADGSANKAEFYNANGQLIKLITDASTDKTVPTLPSMAGYNSASSWKQYNGEMVANEGENITPEGTMIFVAQYELKEPAEVTVTVVDGNGTATVPYGEEVTCTPDASKGTFKWWTKTVNGASEIVSIDETYKFLAWENCTVTAEYGSEKPEYTGNKMKIIIDTFMVGNTENGIMAEFIGFDADTVEKGIVVGNNKIAMTRTGNQFTVTGEGGETAKGYAIVKDGENFKLIVDGEVTLP